MSYPTRQRLLALYAPPEDEPISLAEAKAYLRVEGAADDAAIAAMLTAVRSAAEQYLRASLMPQQWKLVYDDLLPSEVPLPMKPVTGIDSVTSIALDGTPTVLPETTYRLSASRECLLAEQVIIGAQVEIIYSAGYADAGSVPEPIKQGMLAHLAELYDGKNIAAGMPSAARAFYAPYRELRL